METKREMKNMKGQAERKVLILFIKLGLNVMITHVHAFLDKKRFFQLSLTAS